jgi:hypothetical protein
VAHAVRRWPPGTGDPVTITGSSHAGTYPGEQRKEADVGGFRDFERKLEQVISGAFAKVFRSAVQPVEIAAALQRECDNNAQILSRDRRMVPNDFHVELAQTDLDRLAPYDTAMAAEFRDQLEDHAKQQGYRFPGPVRIEFGVADDLTTGRFRVRSRAQAQLRSNATHTQLRRARAFVEAAGQRHPLRPPATVVGRGTEADIRVDDPGVSRRHVEFQLTGGDRAMEVRARDLGSTNGMLVDGHRISSTSVRDGATIKIGNTTLTVRIVTEAVDGDADV